uniref:Uncharacterized protein n=1 Tax=Sphaerodactylus townsendi TaxID=933632 RepID=A0ACB8FW16_9SAUR
MCVDQDCPWKKNWWTLNFSQRASAIGTQGAISEETKKVLCEIIMVDISSNGEDWISLKEGNKPWCLQGTLTPPTLLMELFPSQF